MSDRLSPELVLQAYARGIFPMAEERSATEIFWVNPERRGIMPLDGFHASRSLQKTMRQGDFEIRINTAFEDVLEGCADRDETWINNEIVQIYKALHDASHAHSLEVFQEDELVGGVYGVTLRGAFFGESMFSRRRDASKIALAHLVDRLNACGFTLFDTQFLTPHLASLGGVEISRASYLQALQDALKVEANFLRPQQTASDHQSCTG